MAEASVPKHGDRGVVPADAAMAAAVLLLGVFLAGTGGNIVRRWESSSARHQSVGFEDQIGMVANTAGLIVIVWWAMSFVIAVVAALLERCGKLRAASAAGKFTPAFMRRLALSAVGLQLITAPLATASTLPDLAGMAFGTPAASAGWTPVQVPGGTGAPPPSPGPASGPGSGPGPGPAPGTPPTAPPAAPAIANPQWQPLSPVVEPGPLAGRSLRHQQPAGQGAEVTVRPGDSLWSLSAARLGPYASDVDIALDWPRVYEANRDTIGGNPHLLRPGQVLRLPPGP
ncbi:LysM peptidoglycan-binding domain-containing protein [Arthrobacter sp. PsM3]|uniref:LysM peptidoglycan-binding domain-containing protein n=1 Tax=Arthrobacter sp. PsM3 TaxID=3030531 RepID=UPI00263B633D|nr:LysM domain-containing protein [Arthrobacter sp. PsM3]MDN4645584.1 LysM domain-containing protein [Arthrobacter sp. PsM3]